MIASVKEVEGTRELEEEIKNGTIVVQFHAEWCQPCKALAPRFEAASNRARSRFVRVDVDSLDADTLNKYSIQSIPRLIKFVDGEAVKDILGRTANDILSEVESD